MPAHSLTAKRHADLDNKRNVNITSAAHHIARKKQAFNALATVRYAVASTFIGVCPQQWGLFLIFKGLLWI